MLAHLGDLTGLRIKQGNKWEMPPTTDPLDGNWTRPDPALKKLMFMQETGVLLFMALFMIPMFMAMTLVIYSEMWTLSFILMLPIIIILAIVGALSRWTVNRMYDRHKFRITDEELIIETGFISTNRVLIPLVQIQQVNVSETWMSKRYGLKNLVVNTAGFAYVPNGGMYGGTVLMGLRNADEVADAILSRVKHVKTKPNGT